MTKPDYTKEHTVPETAPLTATAKGSKLVRLDNHRAVQLEQVAEQESRTHIAQLGLIFDAGLKALGYAENGET